MFIRFWQALLAAVVVSAATPTRSVNRRQDATSPKFVSTSDGHFSVNGAPLNFVGTNAYWLPTLNSDDDIDKTLASIAAAGIKVVRTWAFNDVETVPQNGTWFQLISNGTTSINEGANGLQKLDTVIRLAEKHNLYILPTLTNNWNPLGADGKNVTARDITPGTGNQLPRNTLSNDFGGMDVYVRTFAEPLHDTFYTNQKIIDTFLNYTTQVVKRYVNSPAVFAWELANDPRCNSTLPSTNGCTPQTITKWHATVAAHIKSVDPNHLVSSGNQGFLCVDCPKLFPRIVTPPPQTSATPAQRRAIKPLTKRGILEERRLSLKKSRELRKRDGVSGGISIRGRWTSTETRRQTDTTSLGPSFDGSHGVDSQDILNIPDIGFGTFQLFPDQATYGPDDPNLSAFDNVVQQGNQWIQQQANIGKLLGKPVSLNAFGLVTQSNAAAFVPFNSTQAPFASDAGTSQAFVARQTTSAPYGVTDTQRDQAYSAWLLTGLQSGLSGMLQYQWSQDGLTPLFGTSIVPATGGTTTTPVVPGTGVSPNDGYGIQGQGEDGAVQTIQQASQQFAAD